MIETATSMHNRNHPLKNPSTFSNGQAVGDNPYCTIKPGLMRSPSAGDQTHASEVLEGVIDQNCYDLL